METVYIVAPTRCSLSSLDAARSRGVSSGATIDKPTEEPHVLHHRVVEVLRAEYPGALKTTDLALRVGGNKTKALDAIRECAAESLWSVQARTPEKGTGTEFVYVPAEGEFYIPYPEEPSGAVAYYTGLVMKAAGLGNLAGHFVYLTPLVRDYITTKLFERPVELGNKTILYRLTEGDARALVVEAFREAINQASVTTEDVTVEAAPLLVSETPAFMWSKAVTTGDKQVFNRVALDSSLEGSFAHFLDRAKDVAAYAKLTQNTRFSIEYLSTRGALRYYYPDFVVRLSDDT